MFADLDRIGRSDPDDSSCCHCSSTCSAQGRQALQGPKRGAETKMADNGNSSPPHCIHNAHALCSISAKHKSRGITARNGVTVGAMLEPC